MKTIPVIAIFCLSLLLAEGCASVTAPEDHFTAETISFSAGDVGKVPAGFSTALTGGGEPVSWVVRQNTNSPGAKYILVQESSDDTSYRFPMCIYDKVVARDVSAEVRYKALAGKVDEAGGIVLRYTPENYYIARANALEDNIDLFKTVNGKRVKMLEVPAKVSSNAWHILRFEAKGNQLKVIYDGATVIEQTDDTFPNAGKIGLWTKADSVSAFTDFKIQPAP